MPDSIDRFPLPGHTTAPGRSPCELRRPGVASRELMEIMVRQLDYTSDEGALGALFVVARECRRLTQTMALRELLEEEELIRQVAMKVLHKLSRDQCRITALARGSGRLRTIA